MALITQQKPGLIYVEGNLLDALEQGVVDYAAQGCNSFVRMGRGLAAEVRARIPAAVKADQKTEVGDLAKLGTYTHVEWPKGTGRQFINGYTQYHWNERRNNEPLNVDGKPVLCDYDAVMQLFDSLHADFNPNWTLGLPLIGCGLAHGDWHRVHTLINEQLVNKGRAVVVFVYDRSALPVVYHELITPQDELGIKAYR